MNTVICNVEGKVARVTLNRPESLNAINSALLQELADAMEHVCGLSDVRLIILSGAGRAFCAGDDLKEMNSGSGMQAESGYLVERLQDISRAMMFSEKIVVTLVNGWAIGGGLSWVLNSDFVVFEEDAKGFFPELGLGLFMSGGATVLLPLLAGYQRATALFAKGEHIDAIEARRIGLVSELAPSGGGRSAVDALCQDLLALPDELLGALKRVRNFASRDLIEAALEEECKALVQAIDAVRSKHETRWSVAGD